jgi:hypothetical protein
MVLSPAVEINPTSVNSFSAGRPAKVMAWFEWERTVGILSLPLTDIGKAEAIHTAHSKVTKEIQPHKHSLQPSLAGGRATGGPVPGRLWAPENHGHSDDVIRTLSLSICPSLFSVGFIAGNPKPCSWVENSP